MPYDITDSLRIAAPSARVFAALTHASELARWWPMSAESDARLHGRLKLVWFNGTSLETSFDEFEQDVAVGYEFGREERVRFTLTPERGGTLFHVSHQCSQANAIHVAQAWAFLKANLKCWLEHGIDLRDTCGGADGKDL